MTLGVLPGLGAPIPPCRIPRYVSSSFRTVPLGAGTATFTDTNGFVQPPGANDAFIAIFSWNSGVDTSSTVQSLTVGGVAATLVGVTLDGVSDSASRNVMLFWAKDLAPGTYTLVYAQGGVVSNQGFIWGAMHVADADFQEDVLSINIAAVTSITYTNFDSLRPAMVISANAHGLTAGQTQTSPAGFTQAVDVPYSTSPTVRIVMSYAYELAPVAAKSYAFGVSGATENRYGGILSLVSKL